MTNSQFVQDEHGKEQIRIGGVAALGGWMPLHFEVDNLHFEERLGRVLVVMEE